MQICWQGKAQNSSPILRCTFLARRSAKLIANFSATMVTSLPSFSLSLCISLSLSLSLSLSHRMYVTHNIGSASALPIMSCYRFRQRDCKCTCSNIHRLGKPFLIALETVAEKIRIRIPCSHAKKIRIRNLRFRKIHFRERFRKVRFGGPSVFKKLRIRADTCHRFYVSGVEKLRFRKDPGSCARSLSSDGLERRISGKATRPRAWIYSQTRSTGPERRTPLHLEPTTLKTAVHLARSRSVRIGVVRFEKILVAILSAERQLSVAKLSAKRIFFTRQTGFFSRKWPHGGRFFEP